MNNPILDPKANPAIAPPEPQILDISDPPVQPHPVYALAYGGGINNPDNAVFRLERGGARYRYGRLIPTLPQFRAQRMYVQNVNSVPTAVPITQASPARTPFAGTSTNPGSSTNRITYPTGINHSTTAPDFL